MWGEIEKGRNSLPNYAGVDSYCKQTATDTSVQDLRLIKMWIVKTDRT